MLHRKLGIIKLQEQRDSGEITQSQYETGVNNLYQAEETNTDDFQIIDNQIDRNTMSPAEFFGTNEYGDGGDGVNDEINTNVDGFDDKVNLEKNGEKSNLELSSDNNGGVNFVSTQKNSDTDKKETKPKTVVYRKSGATARFTPPGHGYDGYSKEEAKEEFLALHQNDSRSTTQDFDYQQLEVLLHAKFKVNTNAVQVEGADAIKFLKSRQYKDEMNLIGPTGGKIVTVPIDIPKKEINTGGLNNLGELDVDNESSSSVVVVAENPIKKINQFNKHFS